MKELKKMKEAMLYERREKNEVNCFLCSHRCKIPEGRFGICGMRENREGTLYTHAYGEVVAANIDPIEKKPLYHFLPGSLSFSIATHGCNFQCGFCQNWQISQTSMKKGASPPGRPLAPEDIVDQAQANQCKSIAYTYTEPTIFFEYAYDTAILAHDKGLYNVFVTNGFMTTEAIETIHPYLDGCNVDLKFFSDDSYKRVCHARLKPVLESIAFLKKIGVWVEITTLIIPDLNDSDRELTDIARYIAGVSRDIPWHISRFHPDYEYTNAPPTPVETLKRAYSLGKEAGLRFIYIGNVAGESIDTRCPACGRIVLAERKYGEVKNALVKGRCPQCKEPLPGVFR